MASFPRYPSDTETRAQRSPVRRTVTESNLPPPNRQSRTAAPPVAALPAKTHAWEAQREERESCLRAVFEAFDLDGNGTLEPRELLALGAMRRELGHRNDLWTEEKNDALVRDLDRNCDGVIQFSEFVEAFEPRMSMLMEDFYETVQEFRQVADLVRDGGDSRGDRPSHRMAVKFEGNKGGYREPLRESSRTKPMPAMRSHAGGYGYDSQARYRAAGDEVDDLEARRLAYSRPNPNPDPIGGFFIAPPIRDQP